MRSEGDPGGDTFGARPSSVCVVRAADREALLEKLGELRAEPLFSAGAIGEGPAVLTIAALSIDDVERALSVARKTGLDRATDDLRAKQGLFVELAPSGAPERIAFMFSGQGSQYPGMMRRLSEEVPEARRVLERIDRWQEDQGMPSLSKVMFSGGEIPRDVYLVQASVLAADLMCHAALSAIGIRPAVVTGHSFGDYAALVAAGVWSIEQSFLATRIRSAAIASSSTPGGMLSVSASLARIEPLLQEAKSSGQLQAANVNAPDQVVVSGTPAALDQLGKILGKERIEHTRLEVPGAFHSTLMESARSVLAVRFEALALSPPTTPYLSSITRRFEDDPEAIRRSLVEQLTRPIDFVDQIGRLLADGVNVLIECGPRGVLASLAKRCAKGAAVAITTTDDPSRPGRFALARVSAMLDARRASSYMSERGRLMASGKEGASRSDGGASGSEEDSVLTLLDGESAAELLKEEGFEEFWSRTRPSVLLLIQGLWAAERGSAVTEAPPPLAESEPPSGNAERPRRLLPSPEEVKTFLLQAFSTETGYPTDLIEVDADLEADLGIDTVKQAQVLGRVRDHFDIRTEEKLSLRDFPTVAHIMRYVDKELSTKSAISAAPARRSRVPMVDLTERRSKPPHSRK